MMRKKGRAAAAAGGKKWRKLRPNLINEAIYPVKLLQLTHYSDQ